ncbi:FMN-binding protein [Flammeovirga sp. EKP202]|uniref:FMN-binding protein n=1 Tax=Flammeovirga sp. EKP202 TaxID=2770592 RepID=UPI00165FF434|nr:FMN-binding protein [Flammeovirga sp. EKP202]MBD0401761.1 FMN-binding protein [Flammeovirga sp. EKP202]
MSATIEQQEQPTSNSKKMLTAMVGIGALCALLIVLTYEGTAERIAFLKQEALQNAIFKVLPGIEKTRAFYLDKEGHFKPLAENQKEATVVYAGFTGQGELAGLAIQGAGQGYADVIKVLYGYNPQKEEIVGFYVLESKETPGLGDKIEKDEIFLANFKAMDVKLNADKSQLVNSVTTVKSGEKNNLWEVDGITGATISSRAIGNILNESTSEMLPIIQRNISEFKIQ